MPGTISRRFAVGLLGAGGLASAVVGHAANSPAVAAPAPELRIGQRFGRWTVSAVYPVDDGALRLGVQGADEHEFILEVLARDASPLSPQPPASTASLAVFVRNGGDGWLPTVEEQGLAAMALADLLSQAGPIAGLLTHSERLVKHQATLVGEVPGALRHMA